MVTQSGTDAAQQGLTSVIGREPVFSLWCGRKICEDERNWPKVAQLIGLSTKCLRRKALNCCCEMLDQNKH